MHLDEILYESKLIKGDTLTYCKEQIPQQKSGRAIFLQYTSRK